MEKLDFKKLYKDLYRPGREPCVIQVPEIRFLQVDGRGDPNEPGGAYQSALELLYTLTYTIKMSPKSGSAPDGYVEYVVPPLEGLWWTEQGSFGSGGGDKSAFCWTAMIRQPDFVTPEVFAWAAQAAEKKKPHLDIKKARLASFTEGLCVQCMHIGHYDTESATIEKIERYARENGLTFDLSEKRRHHELYLNDPRKVAAHQIKTILRYPVRKI